MKGIISGKDFINIDCQKYWSFPSSYSKARKQEELKKMIFSDDYIGAEKKDGYYQRIVKDDEGNCYMIARNEGVSGIINKIEWVPHLNPFFAALPNGTCLVGEVYLPEHPGSKNITTILGCLKEKAIIRQEKADWRLHFYTFDIYAYAGEILLDKPIIERVKYLDKLPPANYSVIAQYVYGAEMIWETLQKVLSRGGEGVVITKKTYAVGLGKRTARMTLKIKKELEESIDAVFTGAYKAPTRLYTGKDVTTWEYWENIKTGQKIQGQFGELYQEHGSVLEPVTKPYFFGWAGSLEVGLLRGDKVVPIGFLSGVNDDLKRAIVTENESLRGRPIQITCMEVDRETKGLRHARFEQFRDDLTIKDCTWERVYGDGEE